MSRTARASRPLRKPGAVMLSAGTVAPRAEAPPTVGKPPPFDAHQVAWINDVTSFKVASKCRRSGFTFAEAFDATKTRFTGERVNDYWYSGLDESTAREFMQYVRMFSRDVFGRMLEIVTGEEMVEGRNLKTFSVTLPAVGGPGGQVRAPRITAMTSSPGNFRSKGGDVCLDEFAKHPDQGELWAAAQGCAMRGGRVRVISTHPTEPNMFDQFVAMGVRRRDGNAKPLDKPVSLHVVDIDAAIAGGLVERINYTEGTSWTRAAFRQHMVVMAGDRADTELFCKTGSQSGSYLPYELLRPCVLDRLPVIPGHERQVRVLHGITEDEAEFRRRLSEACRDADALFLGSDIGRKKDRFGVAAVTRRGGMDRVGPILSWQARPFGDMKALLSSLMRAEFALLRGSARVRRLVLDNAGLGMQLAEEMEHAFRTRVEGVNTGTAAVREAVWTLVRSKVEERTVGLPDDLRLLAQLNGLRKIVTAGKHDRFDVERNEEGHSDEATALGLGLYAASHRTGEAGWVRGRAW